MQEAFKEVMEREKLDVAAQPHVHDVKFDEGQPLTFELHLEVRPKLELARTDGFRITRTETPVTDDAVTQQIETLRDQKATWAPVEEKPHEGDMVKVLLATPETAGGEMPEGSPYNLVLGGGQAIPGVEELIMELAPGETKERVVKWPDDFPDETQRGATKNVRVTLQEVKRKAAPALDDAFAREVGDFDSIDALTTAVRTDLAENAKRDADALVRQQLVDEIVQANPFDVPPSWVTRMIDAYMQAYKIPEEQRDALRRGVRLRRGAAGSPRHDHRRDRRAAAARGDGEGRRRPRRRPSPSSAAAIRVRCTRRCRRPDGSRRSSAASRKRRCSSG